MCLAGMSVVKRNALRVVLVLLISQSKHRSDAGTLLDSVYTD